MIACLDKICPGVISRYCRRFGVYLNKKFGKKQKSYDGINEFEEEEFSISQIVTDVISPSPSQQSPLKQESEPLKQDAISNDFKINLQPYDQYYQLIEPRTRNLKQLFLQHKTSIPLDIDTSQTKFAVYECAASTGFKFIITYTLPCSYSFFHSINNNTQLISQFSKHIDEYELKDTVHPNLQIMSLSFKKILGLGLEPRRFLYAKYMNSSNQFNHWEICLSIGNNEAYRATDSSSMKEASLFSATNIEESTESSESSIKIQTYLELDLRSIIKAHKIVQKGLKQIGGYVQNLHDYAVQNYVKQSA